ncbi:hypothetical protein Vadar_016696 [Vaccinium darrowii]|uniref:Uncharacterized protein n=1 Tax=Vaccinium darrowii TaxID=229202 RepID=A0ACB7ZD62_9ERIC|nr:hypothetical protein Vadar_016696 [Vaccinium darrowii]
MVLCLHCARDSPETIDLKSGSVSCVGCGKVCCNAVFIDGDVNRYLNTKEEYSYKKIIWEAMNRDYLHEQAQNKAYGSAQKSREKRRRQQRQKQTKNVNAAAAKTKKRKSSKINYDVIDKLFNEEDPGVVSNGKRTRVEPRDGNGDDKYEADTKNCNDNEEEDGEVEEEVEEEEKDTEEWYSRNEEEEGNYGCDDDGDEECLDFF